MYTGFDMRTHAHDMLAQGCLETLTQKQTKQKNWAKAKQEKKNVNLAT